jgi:hypothetical protein
MIDVTTILAGLKLLDFGVEKLKGKLTKKQRQAIARGAENLIRLATDDDVERYAVGPKRSAIEASSGERGVPKPPKKSAPVKKKVPAKKATGSTKSSSQV